MIETPWCFPSTEVNYFHDLFATMYEFILSLDANLVPETEKHRIVDELFDYEKDLRVELYSKLFECKKCNLNDGCEARTAYQAIYSILKR